MYTQDFSGDDLSLILMEMSKWVNEHSPKNPKLVVLEQNSSWICFQIICDDYDD